MSLAACACIIWLSPVEDANKPLDDEENRVYRTRAISLLSVEIALTLALIFLDFRKIAMTIEIVWLTLNAMLIIGKIKNGIIVKNKKEEI